jgi:dienelactone hydrolase
MPRPVVTTIVLLTVWTISPGGAQPPAAPPQSAQQQAPQPRPDDPPHETLFYQNGSLKLEAYFFKPAGAGPFPLVVYNHGSRANQERLEWPVYFIARILVPAGYAVLVPERRGYGQSAGTTFTEEIGADERGQRFVDRLAQEATDISAAIDYAKAKLPIDPKRIVMQGYSFGGIVTTLAAARSTSLRAVVNQAPGALNWDKSPELRAELTAAAKTIRVPMICMAAENDLTTESARVICATAKAAGAAAETKIYPPFVHPTNPNPRAPGHALFAPIGVDIWKHDLLDFLAKHTR